MHRRALAPRRSLEFDWLFQPVEPPAAPISTVPPISSPKELEEGIIHAAAAVGADLRFLRALEVGDEPVLLPLHERLGAKRYSFLSGNSKGMERLACRHPGYRFYTGYLSSFAAAHYGRFLWTTCIEPRGDDGPQSRLDRLRSLVRLTAPGGFVTIRESDAEGGRGWDRRRAVLEREGLDPASRIPLPDGTELIVSTRRRERRR